MQEVRQNDAVILACDVTAQHLKTGATIMPYGCPNVDRTTSTLQTCLCDVECFTTTPPESVDRRSQTDEIVTHPSTQLYGNVLQSKRRDSEPSDTALLY